MLLNEESGGPRLPRPALARLIAAPAAPATGPEVYEYGFFGSGDGEFPYRVRHLSSTDKPCGR